MRRRLLLTAGFLALAAGTARAQGPPPLPGPAPPMAEVEATWTGFWTQVAEGDLAAAGRYLHSSRRYPLSGDRTLAALQELARQMAFCRLESRPFAGGGDEVAYLVRCRYGSEMAERVAVFRRDSDGVWRLHTF